MRERRKPAVFSPRQPPSKHPDLDLLLSYEVQGRKGFKEVKESAELGLKSAWKLGQIMAKLCRVVGLNPSTKYRLIYFDHALQSKL